MNGPTAVQQSFFDYDEKEKIQKKIHEEPRPECWASEMISISIENAHQCDLQIQYIISIVKKENK